MRVAHRILDQQVGHAVAKLRVARRSGVALQLTEVLAIDNAFRIEHGIDRLTGDSNVQADEVALGVEAGR